MAIPFLRSNCKQKHPLYYTWNSMFIRCYYPNANKYEYYGGRGIEVSRDWFNFLVFLEDMGPRPGRDYQLDRIDSGGHYEKSNCRWYPSDKNRSRK